MQWETLHEPLVTTGDGQIIQGRNFQLADDWDHTSGRAAAIAVVHDDVQIKHVRLRGSPVWLPRWNTYVEGSGSPPGIRSDTSGIRIQNHRGLVVDTVDIMGFPRSGIAGNELTDIRVRRPRVNRCFQAISFQGLGATPNTNIAISGHSIWDMWGPGPNKWPGISGVPSASRPGGFVGSDGIVVEACKNVEIRDGVVYGDVFAAMKCVGAYDAAFQAGNFADHLRVLRCRGNGIMIQGTTSGPYATDPYLSPPPAGYADPDNVFTDVLIEDCHWDKSFCRGYGTEFQNQIQLSYGQETTVRRCSLYCGSHNNGHGIQAYHNVTAVVEDCYFNGFNQMRGSTPAHAFELYGKAASTRLISTLNGSQNGEAFEAANTFENQTRILLVS